jgi:hypothetical protein
VSRPSDALFKKQAEKALAPLSRWAHDCHNAALALVNAGLGVDMRVARGWKTGVTSQHSWVVVGMDCYDLDATIIDPTLWSYVPSVKGVHVTTRREDPTYRPHGAGDIWQFGRPDLPKGPTIQLKPKKPFSKDAALFLELLGPLDWQACLASRCPVEGWPAGEILAAIDDTPSLESVVPIDRIGMLTDRNPSGLYLPTARVKAKQPGAAKRWKKTARA